MVALYIVIALVGGAGLAWGVLLLKDHLTRKLRSEHLGPPRGGEDDVGDDLILQPTPQVVFRDLPLTEAERIRQENIERLQAEEHMAIQRISEINDEVLMAEARLVDINRMCDEADARVQEAKELMREAAKAALKELRKDVDQALIDVHQAFIDAFETTRYSADVTLGELGALVKQFHIDTGTLGVPKDIAVKVTKD